jgi:glycerol-3-phosphate acyltransferase PlsY|tara:strand:- start:1909 stop:2487 length:579 start_codon:yes stop_codon:yes gene_type:complete
MDILYFILIPYLIGSIPTGFILTKLILKKDIRNIGSGNIGATNALRTGNKLIGYTTLVFDILKAVIPIFYIKFFHLDYIFICSLCIFLGHVFPIWLKFKGGKGVATYLGILFCLNISLGFLFIIIWLMIYFIFKYSSLGSIAASAFAPFLIVLTNYDNFNYFYVIMFVLILFTHRENIKRLINKEESKTKIY